MTLHNRLLILLLAKTFELAVYCNSQMTSFSIRRYLTQKSNSGLEMMVDSSKGVNLSERRRILADIEET